MEVNCAVISIVVENSGQMADLISMAERLGTKFDSGVHLFMTHARQGEKAEAFMSYARQNGLAVGSVPALEETHRHLRVYIAGHSLCGNPEAVAGKDEALRKIEVIAGEAQG